MMTNAQLPHVLAAINVATILALLAGLYYVQRGQSARHRMAMITALVCGVAFLAVYVVYHLESGLAKFGGTGIVRPVYFSILIVHILMSAVAAALVPVTAWRAIAGQNSLHRRLARTTWSLWMLVATSGLVVYTMTVHIWPHRPAAHTAAVEQPVR